MFSYESKEDLDTIIECNGSLQIERAIDYTVMSRIEWISECTYTTECYDVINRPNDPRISIKLIVDILRIENNRYRYDTRMGWDSQKVGLGK
mgnify:CR=1 FL=1|tara:strand:- start:221 stop:496 length:276 start_codon:yes stop_codon:yes gene_type:complete